MMRDLLEKTMQVEPLEAVQEKIVKKGSKWQVQSSKGKNMGTYDTKEEAEKRLKQVEYFKHKNESVDEGNNATVKEIFVNQSEWQEIVRAAIGLYKKVVGKEPDKKIMTEKFFKSYDSAVKDLKRFYEHRPSSNNDYLYPLISSNDRIFYNENMKNKFNKTHIQKRVGGVFIYAGYLALGSAGIGLRLPASKWSNKPKNESVDEGRGENLSPSDVDRGQLIKGIKVEYEHIGDGLKEPDDALVTRFVDGQYDNITKQDLEKLVRAQEIALDHLAELDDYYDRLEHMEGEASEAVKRYLPKAKKMTCPTCTHTEVTKDKKCPECGNVMVATKTYDQFRESK